MPDRNFSEGFSLPDGRRVRVLGYEDGSVRLRLDGTPYVLTEAYLSGGTNDHAIVRLSPLHAPVEDKYREAARTCQVCGVRAESISGVRHHARYAHGENGG